MLQRIELEKIFDSTDWKQKKKFWERKRSVLMSEEVKKEDIKTGEPEKKEE